MRTKESSSISNDKANKNNVYKGKIGLVVIFLIGFLSAIMSDLSVYQLSIPVFDELKIYEGRLIQPPHGRHNPYMALESEEKTILFACRISAGLFSKCLSKEQRQLYIGKKARIYVYSAAVNGVFQENRLLQLDVEGKTIISYQDQKSEYIHYKNEYPYFSTWFSVIIFLGYLIYYFLVLNNFNKRINQS